MPSFANLENKEENLSIRWKNVEEIDLHVKKMDIQFF